MWMPNQMYKIHFVTIHFVTWKAASRNPKISKWTKVAYQLYDVPSKLTLYFTRSTSIFLQFQPYVKVYSYHLLYNGHDLVADIGGYLGLFLGMSIFGFVESIEKALLRKKTSGGKKRSLKRVSSSPVSNGPQRNRRMSLVRRETFEEVEIDE